MYNEDIGMEFNIEICTILIEKSGKRQMTERIELQNKEKIRTLREKETYKYLGILDGNPIKQAEMKEKIKKSITGELENYSKPNITEISLKGLTPWLSPS